MKAAVWHGRRDIRVEDVHEPDPAPDEVKIRVKWCGICGTDIGEYLHGPVLVQDPPVILGHEYVGEIVAVGENAQDLRVGDRVTALNVRSCGRCGQRCKIINAMASGKKMELCSNMKMTGLSAPGAFAEYICIPAYLVVRLSDAVSWEEGTMINPLSVAIHACKRGSLHIGESVVVIGDGTIGQLTLQACLAGGAGQAFLVGEQPRRLEIAHQNGAGAVFHHRMEGLGSAVMAGLGGDLPAVTFDCVGSETSARMALDLVGRDGRVVLVGIYEERCGLDLKDVVVQEKTLIGVLSQDYEDYRIGDTLIATSRLETEPLITKKIDLVDLVNGGIEELIHNRDSQLRILVQP